MANNPNSQYPANTNAPDGNYPYGSARNIAVPGDGIGTPWEEDITNDIFGFQQKLLNAAGIVPSGSPETILASQYYTAMQACAGFPGLIVPMAINVDPATAGIRVLVLDGSGVLVASYPELAAIAYVGDSANPTAGAFYRADDAAGTIRNTTGNYLILPDTRGRFPRGLDASGTVDPDGATRTVGDDQDWAFFDHYHQVKSTGGVSFEDFSSDNVTIGSPGITLIADQGDVTGDDIWAEDVKRNDYGPLGGTSAVESRPVNFSVNWGVWY